MDSLNKQRNYSIFCAFQLLYPLQPSTYMKFIRMNTKFIEVFYKDKDKIVTDVGI
jgi:hypothetical protein